MQARTSYLPLLLGLLSLAAGFNALAWESRPLADLAVYPARSAQAQVVSLNESRVAAEIAAPILRLVPEPGQVLAKGALLAELDCRDYKLAAESAQAALAAAQAQARLAGQQRERAVQLAQQNFISRDLLDTRETEWAAARAQVAVQQAAEKTARRQVDKCVVRAPFPALVLERLAQEGEMAAPGTPLLRLLDRSRIQVKAEVREADGADLAQARDVALVTPAGRHPLRLLRVSPAVASATRLAEARFTFAGESAPPGASGQIRWTSRIPHLPPELLVRRGGRLGIYVATAGDTKSAPRFQALEGAEEGRPARVADLPLDTAIVVKGAGALR
ncbi:MAG: efflux RND transporter periplasmic adaptor subunit [Pseudomonadota bacterium]